MKATKKQYMDEVVRLVMVNKELLEACKLVRSRISAIGDTVEFKILDKAIAKAEGRE